MKKLTLLFLISLCVFSCVDEDKELPIISDANSSVQGVKVRQFIYEDCEYIYIYRKMAHKGNCKNIIHCYNK